MVLVGKLVEGGILKWHVSFCILPFASYSSHIWRDRCLEMQQTACNYEDGSCSLIKKQKERRSLIPYGIVDPRCITWTFYFWQYHCMRKINIHSVKIHSLCFCYVELTRILIVIIFAPLTFFFLTLYLSFPFLSFPKVTILVWHF